MSRWPPFLALVALAGCAGSTRFDDDDNPPRADPSKVVAAELAFARAAQEKGQWTAFADYSTDDAVMFVPEPVNAHDWLKGRANPPQSVAWQPYQVWASCDGSLAVSRGPWQRPNGTVGYFTTVWARQRNGEYKWVMDQGDALEQPLLAREMIDAKVADCPVPSGSWRSRREERAAISAPACVEGRCQGGGQSADGTLTFAYTVEPSGRKTVVTMRTGEEMREVMRSEVVAQ